MTDQPEVQRKPPQASRPDLSAEGRPVAVGRGGRSETALASSTQNVTYTDYVSLLLGASLVSHLDDAKDAVAVYADARHIKSACVFCDMLDRQGAVKTMGTVA